MFYQMQVVGIKVTVSIQQSHGFHPGMSGLASSKVRVFIMQGQGFHQAKSEICIEQGRGFHPASTVFLVIIMSQAILPL